MKRSACWSLTLFLTAGPAVAEEVPPPPEELLSEVTQDCLTCHEAVSPGIVEDWKRSRHARITPAAALQKPRLERRISSDPIPEPLAPVVVGCYECHGLNLDDHADAFEHFGYRIQVVVSPDDCLVCHATEAAEYARSKKAHAVDNLRKNPIFHTLAESVTGVVAVSHGQLVRQPASEATRAETCYGCHGTEVGVRGLKTVETEFGDVEVPDLTGWPNQGVGRVNPDGSRGACTACHPRHSFSIEIARKPFTCAQCHLQPDVPAWDVYRESKHGNIFLSKQQDWDWDRVPWTVGQDFQAPTCAACHNSLLVSPDGEVIAPRTHDFGDRLWVRLFGLIYSHPQPLSGATHTIRNRDGQPLPTTFDGVPAAGHLIDAEEQARRRRAMKKICLSCHSTSWADGHFARMDSTVEETDKMVAAATHLVRQAWDKGLADPANPFDESIEKKWVEQWLFYANSVRYASAMSGPDYATFKNGWWELQKNLEEMREMVGSAAGAETAISKSSGGARRPRSIPPRP